MPDFPAIPATGIVKLQRGQVYPVAKTLNLKSCTLMADGTGPNPVIKYTGAADSGAVEVSPGQSATVSDIDFDVIANAYAAHNTGGLRLLNVGIKGGGGLLKITGATGTTYVQGCKQYAPFGHFGILAGPKILRSAGGYTETFNGPIIILDTLLDFGSLWMGVARFHAYTLLYMDRCALSDTKAQSANPQAVQNSVARFHYGNEAYIRNSTIAGLVFCGPLNAHIDGGDTLPPGPERTFVDNERAKLVVFDTVQFKEAVITAAPGSNVELVNCPNVNVVTPGPYMNRPVATVTTRAK